MRTNLRAVLSALVTIALLSAVATACDSDSDDASTTVQDVASPSVDVNADAATVGPGDSKASPAKAVPNSNCVGLAETNITQKLHDFCAEALTDALTANGDTCFEIDRPDNPTAPICLYCALKGGTQKLCVQQFIP